MITDAIVDRNVSGFLTIHEFVQYRKTCKELYNDQEAWQIRSQHLPLYVNNPKHKLGLHYLLKWSTMWEDTPGSVEWYQRLVDWLEYKVSIKIIFSFIRSQKLSFFPQMDWANLSCRQKHLWEFIYFRNRRLFKPCGIIQDVRASKRMRYGDSDKRILQSCF